MPYSGKYYLLSVITVSAVIDACRANLTASATTSTINCGFNSTDEEYCGWTPRALGSAWHTGISIQPPPPDAKSYAYIRSAQEYWAQMESRNFTVILPNVNFTFKVMQQRFEVGQNELVKLFIVPAENPAAATLVWGIKNSLVDWTAGSITLPSSPDKIRLRFEFKVGIERHLAALSSLQLSGENAITLFTQDIWGEPVQQASFQTLNATFSAGIILHRAISASRKSHDTN
ncbi:hypothetical protein BV898_02423 [Hypsibius exemplaris]|uniref:MAM domain-containing protein n=1 Tax=Hypsibius exemplaris TaxID=2072580 RepID=A0A1W0X831_HYPEX|nr:hypothetical protein BV898_02423 [Hypsibius exemplaris]